MIKKLGALNLVYQKRSVFVDLTDCQKGIMWKIARAIVLKSNKDAFIRRGTLFVFGEKWVQDLTIQQVIYEGLQDNPVSLWTFLEEFYQDTIVSLRCRGLNDAYDIASRLMRMTMERLFPNPEDMKEIETLFQLPD